MYVTNAALVAGLALMVWLTGVGTVALVQLSTMTIASIIGVWLFSVQHRFEHAQWSRRDSWDPTSAALLGSSHLKLPSVLHWCTGNIGFHHIHHLVPRVPNYRLADCHRAFVALNGRVASLTLSQALCAPSYVLWDEGASQMVTLRDLRK